MNHLNKKAFFSIFITMITLDLFEFKLVIKKLFVKVKFIPLLKHILLISKSINSLSLFL